MHRKEYFILFILTIAFALGIYFYFSNNIALSPVGNTCTADALVCPDGSAVSRTGPNCEFAKCPEAEQKNEQASTEQPAYAYIKDWKIYQNDKYNFEFQYPDYWKASGKPVKDNFVSLIDELPSEENPDTIEFSARVIADKKYTSLDSFLKEQDRTRLTAWEGKPSITIRSSEKININGSDAIRREIYNNAAGFPGIETFILKSGTIYNLSINIYVGEIVLGRSRLYDKVIGTFRFTE